MLGGKTTRAGAERSIRPICFFLLKNGARFLPLEGLNFSNKDFLFNVMGVLN
jgi:hypothetical protein